MPLPKFVKLVYTRRAWLVMSDPLVVYECSYAYELFFWLERNGYAMRDTETWEYRYERVVR